VFVWKTWSYGALDQGVTRMYGVGGSPPERGVVRWRDRFTTVDYPPVALYELAVAGAVYRAFVPSFDNTRWLNVAMKLPPLLAEIGLAILLWRLVRRRFGETSAVWAAIAFWANPAMILQGSVLGYLDPLMALPAVGAIAAATLGWPFTAGALLAIACLTKAQAVFIAPVVALAIWNCGTGRRIARAARSAAAAAAVAALTLVPFAAAGTWRNVVQGVGSLLRHDMLSADAANLWWVITYVMRAAYATHDLGAWAAWTMTVRILGISRVAELGYANPRPWATAAVIAAAAWALWRMRRSRELPVMLACAAFVVHAYFVLGVQVHENHLYLAVPLLAAAAAVHRQLRPVFYGVSAVFALNLFLFFGIGRGFPVPPRNFTVIDSTVLLALANCALLLLHARRLTQITASAT
jgi:4-amino-4-deoxy-L-arabinose transferase-like glycosyltransferase